MKRRNLMQQSFGGKAGPKALVACLACLGLTACTPQQSAPPPPPRPLPLIGGLQGQPPDLSAETPRIRVAASGVYLNAEQISIEEAVNRVRQYRKEHPPTENRASDWVLVVTIDPDVRFSDERTVRAAIDKLGDAPDHCIIKYEIPQSANFPSRGD
jgi:hypothetical protein